MSEVPPDNPTALDELEEFIALLDRFRHACGRPSLRELSRVSEQVRETYGRRYPKFPTVLSLTALSDVLNGRRKKPPPWGWVAMYVLSCQRFAAESGLRPDPGDATLPSWNLRLQAVHRPDVVPPADEDIVPEQAAEKVRTPPPGGSGERKQPLSAPTYLDAPAAPADPPAHKPTGQDPGPNPSPPTASAPPSASTSATVSASASASAQATAIASRVTELEVYAGDRDHLSLSEQRFFAMYGQHGVRLIRAAEGRRDPDAEYRLGVLLCVDDRPNEALAFLMRAETGGHPQARELIESPAQRRAALVHAWKLGARDAADHAETASLYLERAARNGHAGAAYELGKLHMQREDPERAAEWFATAAECGHPLAEWWSGRSREAGPRTASAPTVDELMTRLYGDPPAGLLR